MAHIEQSPRDHAAGRTRTNNDVVRRRFGAIAHGSIPLTACLYTRKNDEIVSGDVSIYELFLDKCVPALPAQRYQRYQRYPGTLGRRNDQRDNVLGGLALGEVGGGAFRHREDDGSALVDAIVGAHVYERARTGRVASGSETRLFDLFWPVERRPRCT